MHSICDVRDLGNALGNALVDARHEFVHADDSFETLLKNSEGFFHSATTKLLDDSGGTAIMHADAVANVFARLPWRS